MSLQNLMAHTAWMECGSSATPPSLFPSTGATASCLLSSVSLLLYSGASCLHASPSVTSGLWFLASRAVWLSLNASAASTLSASRPSATPSLKPWARSSAVCALHCVKKSKYSDSSVYSTSGWSVASFYTPEDQSRHLNLLFNPLPPPPFITCCSPPSHPEALCSESWHAHCAFLRPEALWQLQQAAWFCDSFGTPGGLGAPQWGRRGPFAMRRISLPSFIFINKSSDSGCPLWTNEMNTPTLLHLSALCIMFGHS